MKLKMKGLFRCINSWYVATSIILGSSAIWTALTYPSVLHYKIQLYWIRFSFLVVQHHKGTESLSSNLCRCYKYKYSIKISMYPLFTQRIPRESKKKKDYWIFFPFIRWTTFFFICDLVGYQSVNLLTLKCKVWTCLFGNWVLVSKR